MGRRQDERFQRMLDHGTEPSSRRQNLGNHARIAADRSVRCAGATKTLQDFHEILKATLPEGMGAIDAVVKIGPRSPFEGPHYIPYQKRKSNSGVVKLGKRNTLMLLQIIARIRAITTLRR